MKTRIVLTAGLFALLAVTAAFGQPSALRTAIDFPFSVGGKVLPPGIYDLKKDETTAVFKISEEGKNVAVAPIRTRIANIGRAAINDALVVFDKVGEDYFLAEVWIPGQDGYVLAVTKAKHEHRIVNVKY